MSGELAHIETRSNSGGDTVCCPLCGQQSECVMWEENSYEGRLCDCGVMYTTPEPPSGAVDLTFDGHLPSYYALPATMKLKWLAKSHPTGTLLEVGCGEGEFLAEAQSFGYRVVGIEADSKRAERIAESLNVTIENAFLENCSWPARSCDIVYHCDLLSHFPDPHLALRKMGTLLRPNGVLFFEVGMVASISPHWYRLMKTLGMPEHKWFFSEKGLRLLLKQSGLRIVRVKRFGLVPSYLVSRFGRLIGFGGGATSGRQKTIDPNDVEQLADRRRRFAANRAQYENPVRAHVHNFVRYRIGALVPHIGPQTFFVIAALEDERASA